VAFVFTASDPFFFADIDHALTGGAWSPLALEVCQRLSGVAIEVSQSNTGLHLIGKYDGPRPEHACKNTALGLELYTADRFVALTGSGAVGDAGLVATAALQGYITQYLTGTGSTSRGSEDEWLAGVALGVAPGATPPATDEDLISRACKSAGAAAAFSGKATFADLWEGRHSGDASSADRAMAQHLAFWTGNDCERIMRIMQQSGLVRDKWNREDYLRRTILSATGSCTRFYTAPAATADTAPVGGPAQKYLGPTQQEELYSLKTNLELDILAQYSMSH
jgi:primase-polymerase (primpol)-like protein